MSSLQPIDVNKIVGTVKRKHPQALCESCPLYSKPCAPTQGPADAKYAIVSRSPGYHEAQVGKPFSGPSGKVLDHLLKQNGYTRNQVMVTNVVLCAPDEGKVPPEAIKACAPRLRSELDGIDTIIAAGSEAVNLLIGRGSIDSHRGYRIERGDKTFVATNNPALVLRDDSTFPNLVRDFRRAFNPMPVPVLPEVTVINDPSTAIRTIKDITRTAYEVLAADTESFGGLTHNATLASFQLSATGERAITFGYDSVRDRDVIAVLRTLLESPTKFVWHNGKHDIKILRHKYRIQARVDEDTILLSYALDERSGEETQASVHALEYLLMEEYGWPNYEPAEVHAWKVSGGTKPSLLEVADALYEYAGNDAGGTHQLFNTLTERAKADNVHKMYQTILIPASELLARMELHGIVYDINAAADLLELQVNPELNQIVTDLRKFLNNPILNPGSPQQMAKLYYDDWGIKHAMRSRPDKVRSIDDTARTEIIEGRYTFIDELREKVTLPTRRAEIELVVNKHDRYQKLKKQSSTYLFGLIEEAEKDEQNRIYTWLSLTGTNSGRLSSRRPNLQNITRPGRHENIPNIRSIFKASPGRLLVNADYKMAELRCMAVFSGDTRLNEILSDPQSDLHAYAAQRFYGDNWTNENRQSAKNMNFGVGYLQSPETFQQKHGIPVEEARPFVKWWRKEFSGVFAWHKEVEKDIRTRGYLASPFGRKRRFHLLTKENINSIIREGVNFYPQTTASDLTLTSAIVIGNEIDWNRAALCLSVHDSNLADIDEDYIDDYRVIVKQVMEAQAKNALGWTLPFLVDTGVGETWAAAK